MQDRINSFYEHLYSNIKVEDKIKAFKEFKHSGFSLTEKIPRDAKILDVGCGLNLLKPFFPNLTGIDPVTKEADYMVTLEEFNTSETYDVILCLGSIQQGDIDYIKTQVAKLSSLLNRCGKIYWRTNLIPRGTIVKSTKVQVSDGFIWTPKIHNILCREFNFTLADLQYESFNHNKPEATRLYAEWIKN